MLRVVEIRPCKETMEVWGLAEKDIRVDPHVYRHSSSSSASISPNSAGPFKRNGPPVGWMLGWPRSARWSICCSASSGSPFSPAARRPGVLFGPTGGYLIGFVVAAFVIGRLVALKNRPGFVWVCLSLTAGTAVIYTLGVLQLSLVARLTL